MADLGSRVHDPDGAFSVLTAGRCRITAARIRDGLDELQLRAVSGTPLDRILRDAEWLGSGPEDLFAAGGRFFQDPKRFSVAFMRMEQAVRLADVLAWAKLVQGTHRNIRQWIEKRIDRIESQADQAQDHLFRT